jgi:urease accessory protein
MKRGFAIRRAGLWNPAAAADRVVLDAGDRHRRRIVLKSEHGMDLMLDLDEAVVLRDGDGIVLDDGKIVLVTSKAESLLEIAAPTPLGLIRLAWHMGNRHADVQVVGDRLRIRHDHVLKDMVIGLGATVAEIDAPFDAEGGGAHDR